jgi:ribonuclease HI
LDPIQNQALRICLGAFRTSPADSLCVEANEPPLDFRRRKLSLQYILKLQSYPNNPAHDCVFNHNHEDLYMDTNYIRPFGLYYKYYLEDLDVDLDNILTISPPPFYPWEYIPPRIDTSLVTGKKSLVNPEVLRQQFLERRDLLYKDRISVFTDGSKSDRWVAAAAVVNGRCFVRRLPNDSSVYSAELTALGLALQFIQEFQNGKFVIFSDSLSCLKALSGSNFRNPLLQEVILAYMEATRGGNDIVLCWVPSHVGVSGNEEADATAKAALGLEVSNAQVPHTDFRGSIKKYIFDEWQNMWNFSITNKLHEVHPNLGEWAHAHRRSRREEVVLARLRIGHTHLTHSHLLKGEPPPRCGLCAELLTIKHILMECNQLVPIRSRFYNAHSMKHLFESVDPIAILNFVKALNMYNKL